MEVRHPIRIAAAQSGLTTHAIRMWEKRYGVVNPERTDTDRRLYSDADIKKLKLLKDAVDGGHSISSIAHLELPELASIAQMSLTTPGDGAHRTDPALKEETIRLALQAIVELNQNELVRQLESAVIQIGFLATLERVIGPLAQEMGARWESGSLRSAHERFATSIIKNFIQNQTRPYSSEPDAPQIIVATPTGQLHELGAIMVAGAASAKGWRVTYLGPGLPAAEIASATRQLGAPAVAISLVYPSNDTKMQEELIALRRMVGDNTTILFGGRAALLYRETIEAISGILCQSLPEVYPCLESIRSQKRQPQNDSFAEHPRLS